jgi:molybdopterin converting factor small subunit
VARIEVKYIAHLSTAADNRIQEWIETDAKTIRDLVVEIDAGSPGFARLMVNPETNEMVYNNGVLLQRKGGLTNRIFSLDTPIEEEDTVVFW